MKNNLSIANIVIAAAVVGLLGVIGVIVYDQQIEGSNDNKTSLSRSSQQNQEKYKDSDDTLITARSCSYVDADNKEARDKRLADAGIEASAGSVCELSSGDTLLSFSQETQTTNEDGSFDATYKYGIVLLPSNDKAPHVNSSLDCTSVPPDPSHAPEISTVVDSKATVICPGYEGATYTYDLNSDTFNKD